MSATFVHVEPHCIALHCIALHCIALHCIALHCIALHCIALHCIALHCTALHCTALHCTALHCTALHCTALHCTALHCVLKKSVTIILINVIIKTTTTITYRHQLTREALLCTCYDVNTFSKYKISHTFDDYISGTREHLSSWRSCPTDVLACIVHRRRKHL